MLNDKIINIETNFTLFTNNDFFTKNEFTANRLQTRPVDVGEGCVFDPYLL